MEYERKCKEAHPVLAMCYDFDKTFSPDDMQAQGYRQRNRLRYQNLCRKCSGQIYLMHLFQHLIQRVMKETKIIGENSPETTYYANK